MLFLRPFKPCDADRVASWLTDEAMMHRWCANEFTKFPLTGDDLLAYYAEREKTDKVFAFVAYDESGLVGHVMMNFRDEEKTVLWLCFVVIDPAKRGKGLGKELISCATRYAYEFTGAKKVGLTVFRNNAPAIKCYESAGFVRVPPAPDAKPPLVIMGEVWEADNMEYRK